MAPCRAIETDKREEQNVERAAKTDKMHCPKLKRATHYGRCSPPSKHGTRKNNNYQFIVFIFAQKEVEEIN